MPRIRYAAIVLLLLFVSGCRKSERFPGFTKVVEQDGVSYFLDKSSVQPMSRGGDTTFSLLASNPDGSYSVGMASTDCDLYMISAKDASAYTSSGRFSATLPKRDFQMPAVQKMACHEAMFGRDPSIEASLKQVLKGGVDDWSPPDSVYQSLGKDCFGKQWTVKSAQVESYVQGSTNRRLIIISSIGKNQWCPLSSAFLFRKDGSDWVVEASSYRINIDDIGITSPADLVKLGPEVTGFSVTGAFFGSSGGGAETVRFFLPTGHTIAPVTDVILKESDELGPIKTYTYTLGPEVSNGMYVMHIIPNGNADNGPPEKESQCFFAGDKYDCRDITSAGDATSASMMLGGNSGSSAKT